MSACSNLTLVMESLSNQRWTSKRYSSHRKHRTSGISKKKTGIAFEDMIFYDNEEHNCKTVKSLGVHCVYTPRGMTEEVWKSSLAEFAKRRS
mmetsp:Transcript_62396/g.91452  ORF Transcript_62396/g.91452 Transcript_62396/m.91452 type:complete len:92 (-) Transcript_62396:24-299(-)